MKREKLIRSKEYIVSQIQLGLLNLIGGYKERRKLKDYQLAEQLGVSKGYISQILNATYDHKISKVVDLALECNAVPLIFFIPMEEYLRADAQDKIYQAFAIQRPRQVTYEETASFQEEIKPDLSTIRVYDNKDILA